MNNAMLGIIGGSGFYDFAGIEITGQHSPQTPFGELSAPLTLARYEGNDIVFLPRHGSGHRLLPSEINYRANIWALKNQGVKQVIAVSAVGSLRQELAPGDVVVPSQYIDWTRGRRVSSFFGDGLVGHVSTAKPACSTLSAALAAAAQGGGDADAYTLHSDKTYVCVEGPRLGTQAESFFLRDAMQADVVGMTNVPEVFLAREAQIAYATLAVVTDYDCWKTDSSEHVTGAEVIERFMQSIGAAKELLRRVIADMPAVNDAHRQVLEHSILTPPEARSAEHKALLEVLGS